MEIIQTPSFPIIYLKNFMKMRGNISFRASILYDHNLIYRQPARTRVVRNFVMGGKSGPEGRGVGVGGGYILGLSHKWEGNFLK